MKKKDGFHFLDPGGFYFFRACVVVDDRLYVIGGQEGDFMAKPGSPIFKCSRRHEVNVLFTFASR